jgi:hypothetical protein
MSDIPPDHLSVDPKSPFYDAEALARDVGVRFKGVEKTNVMEYCVSEGWCRLEVRPNGPTVKIKGAVEPYFRDTAPAAAEG